MTRLETESLPLMEKGLEETRNRLAAYDAPLPVLGPPPDWSHPTPIERSNSQ